MAILDDDIDKKKQPKSHRNTSAEKSFSETLGLKLDGFSASYSDEDMEKIVSYLQEWNTNAKHSFVSQAVLSRYDPLSSSSISSFKKHSHYTSHYFT